MFTDAYLQPSRVFMMELFAKIVNGLQLLTVFTEARPQICLTRF